MGWNGDGGREGEGKGGRKEGKGKAGDGKGREREGKGLVPPPHDLFTRPICLQVVFVGYVICFLQFTFREHLHNVCTISGVLYYSTAFVEVEYFDDLNALIDVWAIFEHAIWLFFFAYVQKHQGAALAIHKVGPMLYRFRSGPTFDSKSFCHRRSQQH